MHFRALTARSEYHTSYIAAQSFYTWIRRNFPTNSLYIQYTNPAITKLWRSPRYWCRVKNNQFPPSSTIYSLTKSTYNGWELRVRKILKVDLFDSHMRSIQIPKILIYTMQLCRKTLFPPGSALPRFHFYIIAPKIKLLLPATGSPGPCIGN